jgi:hypothetical protein
MHWGPGDRQPDPRVVVFRSERLVRGPPSSDRTDGAHNLSRFRFMDDSRVFHDFKARKQLNVAGWATLGYHADAPRPVGGGIV